MQELLFRLVTSIRGNDNGNDKFEILERYLERLIFCRLMIKDSQLMEEELRNMFIKMAQTIPRKKLRKILVKDGKKLQGKVFSRREKDFIDSI